MQTIKEVGGFQYFLEEFEDLRDAIVYSVGYLKGGWRRFNIVIITMVNNKVIEEHDLLEYRENF